MHDCLPFSHCLLSHPVVHTATLATPILAFVPFVSSRKSWLRLSSLTWRLRLTGAVPSLPWPSILPACSSSFAEPLLSLARLLLLLSSVHHFVAAYRRIDVKAWLIFIFIFTYVE